MLLFCGVFFQRSSKIYYQDVLKNWKQDRRKIKIRNKEKDINQRIKRQAKKVRGAKNDEEGRTAKMKENTEGKKPSISGEINACKTPCQQHSHSHVSEAK